MRRLPVSFLFRAPALGAVALGTLFLGAPLPALAEAATPEPAAEAPADAPAEASSREALPAISVSAVQTRVLRDRVIASGFVRPVEQVNVAPLIEGQQIEALLADVGDRVEAGQVLARLSKTALELQRSQLAASLAAARAAIAQAEAGRIEAESSAAEARRVADRTAALKKQGTASQAAADQAAAAATSADARVMVAVQTLESARANLSLVEAQIANIELNLARTDVIAPVSGEITERNARLGGIASAAGQPLFVMIRDGALELGADVAEADLIRLAPGQPVQLTTVASTTPLGGKVRLVEPSIDPATRLGRARIFIEDASQVRPGMFGSAEILVSERSALAVPVTAVGSGPEGQIVTRVADGVVSRVPVTTGIRDGGWIEVTGGLNEGDVIVTKAGTFVREGDRINPILEPVN